jgi:hypothetical protein
MNFGKGVRTRFQGFNVSGFQGNMMLAAGLRTEIVFETLKL